MTKCSESRVPVKRATRPAGGCRFDQVTFSFGGKAKPTLKFDAEATTSDAWLAPLRELDERLGLTELAASRIEDLREPDMVVHPVPRLLRETIYAYTAGYEDASDVTPLRDDPWFRELVGPISEESVNPKKQDGLASEPTISRLLGRRKLVLHGFGLVHAEGVHEHGDNGIKREPQRSRPSSWTFQTDGVRIGNVEAPTLRSPARGASACAARWGLHKSLDRQRR